MVEGRQDDSWPENCHRCGKPLGNDPVTRFGQVIAVQEVAPRLGREDAGDLLLCESLLPQRLERRPFR